MNKNQIKIEKFTYLNINLKGLLKCNYCNYYATKVGLIKSHESLHADKGKLKKPWVTGREKMIK